MSKQTVSRRPKCHHCGKPLGSTDVYCYECLSDDDVDTSDYSDESDSMNDVWAAQWKLDLGVDEKLVFEQHEYDAVKDYLV